MAAQAVPAGLSGYGDGSFMRRADPWTPLCPTRQHRAQWQATGGWFFGLRTAPVARVADVMENASHDLWYRGISDGCVRSANAASRMAASSAACHKGLSRRVRMQLSWLPGRGKC